MRDHADPKTATKLGVKKRRAPCDELRGRMHSFLLQDWVCVQGDTTGSASVSQIIQDGSEWLDLEGYQDLGFWFEVSAVVGGTVTLVFETSPTREESLFALGAMRSWSVTAGTNNTGGALAANMGTSVSAGQTSVPLARWVRWRVATSASGVAWSITFRIIVTGTTNQ